MSQVSAVFIPVCACVHEIVIAFYVFLFTEEESIEYVTNEIQKFINGLRSSNFITQAQHVLLTQLLQQNA